MAEKILVVDDDLENQKLIQGLLQTEGYTIDLANDGKEALEKVGAEEPDLILLDMNMPRLNGLETLEQLRESNDSIPVIFVTANDETHFVVKGLDAGAQDYICKPFSPMELLARVRTQMRMKKLQDQLIEANTKLKDLVEVDDLTGLLNMRSVFQRLDLEIGRARRHGHGLAVVMLDMDHFKRVNDNHDHLFGSFVLSELGQIIKNNIRQHDFAARYGGDEFLICLSQTEVDGAKLFCERLRQTIEAHSFENGADHIQLTASLGMAVIDGKEARIDGRALVRHADHELYRSKNLGRNRVSFKMIRESVSQEPTQ